MCDFHIYNIQYLTYVRVWHKFLIQYRIIYWKPTFSIMSFNPHHSTSVHHRLSHIKALRAGTAPQKLHQTGPQIATESEMIFIASNPRTHTLNFRIRQAICVGRSFENGLGEFNAIRIHFGWTKSLECPSSGPSLGLITILLCNGRNDWIKSIFGHFKCWDKRWLLYWQPINRISRRLLDVRHKSNLRHNKTPQQFVRSNHTSITPIWMYQTHLYQ